MSENPITTDDGFAVLPGGTVALLKQWGITEWGEPFKDQLPAGVNVKLQMQVVDGVPHCTEVRFVATREDKGVPAKALREFRLEDWIERACKAVAFRIEGGKSRNLASADSSESLQLIRRARARARGGYTDEMLREVADIYMKHADHHPTKAVRQAFAVAPSTAQLYVKTARGRTDPTTGERFLSAATKSTAGEPQ